MNVGVVIGTWTGGRARNTFRSNLLSPAPLGERAMKKASDWQDRPAPDSLRVFGPLLEKTAEDCLGTSAEP